MKRLLVAIVLGAILIGALGSHGKSSSPMVGSSEPAASPTTSAVAPTARPAAPRDKHCDQNISAGAHTTCGFAANVFRAFARKVSDEGSEPADYAIEATSSATGKTYSMECSTSSGTTTCSGARAARVRFPLWAAQAYYKPPAPKPKTAPRYKPPPSAGEPEAEPSEPAERAPTEECTNGTYENSAGNIVCKPEESPTQPSGASARCEDGTYSFSESRSGTCSHHGGVTEWLE
jgi:hypothetical protein